MGLLGVLQLFRRGQRVVEVVEADEVLEVQFEKLLLLHSGALINGAQLIEQKLDMGRQLVLFRDRERNSGQFFDQFLLAAALPRRQAHQQLVVHNSDREDVAFRTVYIFEERLDGHIKRSADILPGAHLLRGAYGKAEVGYLPGPIAAQHVGRLQVSVHDSHAHQVLGAFYHVGHDGAREVLREPALSGEELQQVASLAEFGDDVGVRVRAVRVVKFDDVGVAQALQYLNFVLQHLKS